ncbi:MAG: malate synthase A [Bradymonadaceae bacterium]|nr:malate synthase A [Lujinxingiaceae bacterium]
MTSAPTPDTSQSVTIRGEMSPPFSEILTPQALEFVGRLHREFNGRRKELLERRVQRQRAIDSGQMPNFLAETAEVRKGNWLVEPIPQDLQNRRVEITGPVDRKMIINALNSGANMFMADFEDSNAPTWHNTIDGQINLRDAIRRRIDFTQSDTGKSYKLGQELATLHVRPRGWHLDEKHVLVDGEAVSASLLDFGLYFFHNAQELIERGSGPYFYLPKLENHLEARLWNEVFVRAQEDLGIARCSIKATVLIETVLAAFEMDEILYELRDHMAGLNAGRWDYIFSIIKTFRNRADMLLPDRDQIVMTVPFMRAYTDLLVQTCHRRGAHAIGGMAAFIPSRRDAAVNERALAKVRQDKERESNDGFDGTWIAHPDLVPVASEPFAAKLAGRPHQKDNMRDDVRADASQLVRFEIPGAKITEQGMRTNINVGIQYIESWLQGIGAAAIFNLMEDAATAEISRSQIWQWIHNDQARLEDGRTIDLALYRKLADEEMANIQELVGSSRFRSGRFETARAIFDRVVAERDFPAFLTLIAYEHLD